MKDLNWERSIPFVNLDFNEVRDIFSNYDPALSIKKLIPIKLGCRNSNFVVFTDKGRFLLRMSALSEMNNEVIAHELVKDRINAPLLLFHTIYNTIHSLKDRKDNLSFNVFIYEYIDAVPLQKLIIDKGLCDPVLIKQAAKFAAIIHSTEDERTEELASFDVPPFECWYDIFLNHETVKNKLGENLCGRLKKLVSDKQSFLPEIDSYKSFIHCDFRLANMLADCNGRLFVVDWESSSMGHSLIDIGQFLRYRCFFAKTDIELFEQSYNNFSNKKLPSNWVELSLFMDLINPLQMLSSNQEMPIRDLDLIGVATKTLAYFGY